MEAVSWSMHRALTGLTKDVSEVHRIFLLSCYHLLTFYLDFSEMFGKRPAFAVEHPIN